MTNKLFLDSNIWVYALSETGDSRESIAREFIRNMDHNTAPVVSYQVINETLHVLKKLGKPESELRLIIEKMFDTCEVAVFTKEAALIASKLRETVSVSFWDSQIVASAITAGCSAVISEDMQDTARIGDSLTICNIFRQ